jgi:hypothetical protein
MKRTLLIALAAVALPLSTFASGSYCACLPKPPVKQAKVDRDKYDLGQKVFNGKAAPSHGDPATQRPKLEALQTQLPEKVRAKHDLPAKAGALSEQQLDALDYFVKQRYPTK